MTQQLEKMQKHSTIKSFSDLTGKLEIAVGTVTDHFCSRINVDELDLDGDETDEIIE